MNAMARSGLNAYAQVAIEGDLENASPHQLILMLFDGAVKSVAKARMAMQAKDVAAKCEAISRAMAIIQEGLQLSLDVKAGGEIATNLNELYEYMCHRLLIANMKNELEALDEVGRLLVDLKATWAAIGPNQAPQKPIEMADAPPPRSAAVTYGKA